MGRCLAGVLVALMVAGCSTAARTAVHGRAAVTPRPAAPVAAAPAPAAVILDSAQVGLPLVAAQDGVSAAEAANEVHDAADALPLYDSWDWVSESTRHFAGAKASVEVTVLASLRPSGAAGAFAFWSSQLQGSCPAQIQPVDQCASGQAAGQAVVVARVGAVAFQISGAGVDPAHLAALQAARIAA